MLHNRATKPFSATCNHSRVRALENEPQIQTETHTHTRTHKTNEFRLVLCEHSLPFVIVLPDYRIFCRIFNISTGWERTNYRTPQLLTLFCTIIPNWRDGETITFVFVFVFRSVVIGFVCLVCFCFVLFCIISFLYTDMWLATIIAIWCWVDSSHLHTVIWMHLCCVVGLLKCEKENCCSTELRTSDDHMLQLCTHWKMALH